VLFSCAAVAIGLLISALTESQAVAFFITFFVLGALWLFGDLAGKASSSGYQALAALLNYVSFQSRLNNFWRGLIDSRDVVFFLSVTVLSLMVAFRALERRKWA
jgi:ABC-2 type transport system permease protein